MCYNTFNKIVTINYYDISSLFVRFLSESLIHEQQFVNVLNEMNKEINKLFNIQEGGKTGGKTVIPNPVNCNIQFLSLHL